MDHYGRYEICINVLGWIDVIRTFDHGRSWDMGDAFAFSQGGAKAGGFNINTGL